MDVHHGEVRLPVTIEGDGPLALFVPGLSITAAGLGELVDALRGFLRLATFDLRGHGASSPSDDYSYAAFAADTAAVVDALDAPILMGFSFGADLALDQAAARPDTPALVLLDGGTPLTEPFLNEEELAGLGASIDADRPSGYSLTGDQHVAALREIDEHRRTSVERFDAVTCPITMIMSTTMAGSEGARAAELNGAWRRGVDDLVATRPEIEVHRLPGGHDLPLVHPQRVAEIVRKRLG